VPLPEIFSAACKARDFIDPLRRDQKSRALSKPGYETALKNAGTRQAAGERYHSCPRLIIAAQYFGLTA